MIVIKGVFRKITSCLHEPKLEHLKNIVPKKNDSYKKSWVADRVDKRTEFNLSL